MVQLPGAGDFLDADKIVRALALAPGQKAADFGCGSGYFSVALAKAVGPDGKVYAIDVMKEPLESVHSRAEGAGLKNIESVRADLEVLGGTKITDGSLDLVMLKNILFQSQKKEAILAEAARVLKPGGGVVVIDWIKGKGGLGPPDALRVEEQALQTILSSTGLKVQRSLPVDQYHFGLIATK